MYYPYFRGKQYDLITIRENAELLASSGFTPIIEPVKEALSGLKRTLEEIQKADGEVILIVNPCNGDHAEDSAPIHDLLSIEFSGYSKIIVGVYLPEEISLSSITQICSIHAGRNIAFIHAGFSDPKGLVKLIAAQGFGVEHVFLEQFCGKLYRKHFFGSKRILLRDGFKKRQANKLHPDVEFFSDLHVTYTEEGMNGFGDFLIVGEEYSEAGGPAYSVAIHVTFIDPSKDDEMHIYHFKSDRSDSYMDPGGKFQEALNKLFLYFKNPKSMISRTSAINEFVGLLERGHFPGLGYVKKLSMQHHIEVFAEYFQSNQG